MSSTTRRVDAGSDRSESIRHRVTHGHLARAVDALRRGYHEFLRVPLVIIGGFLALSIVTYQLDSATIGVLAPIRRFMSRHVFADPQATGQLLGAIAGSLITVASITFSLLLLAIQQSAGSMTHAVIDQFLRRKVNQAFFGFFVGLAIFALITLATVAPPFNPVYGASLVLGLAIFALCLVILLIYTTIHQMRPAVIIQGIHDLTLIARDRQLDLLAGSREERQGTLPVVRDVTSAESGYLVNIDIEGVITAVNEAGAMAEVEFVAPVGAFVAYRDTVAIVRAKDGQSADAIADVASNAVHLAGDRSLEMDPTYGIEQLLTIAWTSISTSKQNPAPGLAVNDALRDLVARLASDEYMVERDPTSPVVYHDTLLDELFLTFEQLAIVSSESMQSMQFSAVAETFARMYGRVPSAWQQRTEQAILHILPGLGDHVLTVRLDRALEALADTLHQHDRHGAASAVSDALTGMRATVGHLHSRSTRVAPE